MKLFFACITCNRQVQEAIWDSTFFPNLLTMLSAFIVLAFLVALLSALSAKRYKTHSAAHPNKHSLTPVPLTTSAMVLGIGLGGFIDGIVLHQVLQWHEMISNKMPPVNLVAKSVNMFWDGVFHAFCLVVVIIGVVFLWKLLWRRDIDRSGNLLAGGFLLGWGLFNIVEGTIDHHLLKLHNVREVSSHVSLWNWGFLGLSVLMMVIGYLLVNKKREYQQDTNRREVNRD
jgi:uncharacterized membrane protein